MSKEKFEIERVLSLPDLVFNEQTYPTSAQISIAYEILAINKVEYVKLSSENQKKTLSSAYKAKSLLTHPDKVAKKPGDEIDDSEKAIAAFKKVDAAKTLLLYLTTVDGDANDELLRWKKTFESAEAEFKMWVSEQRKKLHLVYCKSMIACVRRCVSRWFNHTKEEQRHNLAKVMRSTFHEAENSGKVNSMIDELPYFYDDDGSKADAFVNKVNSANALLSLEVYAKKAALLKKLAHECKVVSLKSQLNSVLAEYIQYSKTHCHFSIFHRHGETGRLRARQFITQLCGESSESTIQTKILEYLKNTRNGNTHPHSFRTMLLQKFTEYYPDKKGYNAVYFNLHFKHLSDMWSGLSSQATDIDEKILNDLLKDPTVSKKYKPQSDTKELIKHAF